MKLSNRLMRTCARHLRKQSGGKKRKRNSSAVRRRKSERSNGLSERCRRQSKRPRSNGSAIERALEEALARTEDAHSAEIEELRRRLTEAEERVFRTKSQAEMTKSGHVYVISNIGSFGTGIFKVGMTRRLDPMDRVKELGSRIGSVRIRCSHDDKLRRRPKTGELALHQQLRPHRVNKVNSRKEFFRVDLEEISRIVEAHHGQVDYVAEPEAIDFYESQNMTDDELRTLEEVFHEFEN